MMYKTIPSIAGKRFFSVSKMKLTQPRHLTSILDLTDKEFESLLSKAQFFKNIFKTDPKSALKYHQELSGKLVAMLFSKRSTRTRLSTEGAAAFFGAQPIFLGKDDIQLGVNETVYDTTRVLSSMTSCIFARVNKHQDILDLCSASSVPIINSLCDRFHPLQAITDLLTIKETFGNTDGLKLAWIGDANNVINDLAVAALKMGISVAVSIPPTVLFDEEVLAESRKIAAAKNLKFEIVHDPSAAIKDASIIVTDTWISMGQEAEKARKLEEFKGYQITNDLIQKSGAASNWIFMHCLPRHQEEVSDDVFYSDRSVVFAEAENRLYAAIAVLDSFVINKGNITA